MFIRNSWVILFSSAANDTKSKEFYVGIISHCLQAAVEE